VPCILKPDEPYKGYCKNCAGIILSISANTIDFDTKDFARTVDLRIQISKACSGCDVFEIVNGPLPVHAIG